MAKEGSKFAGNDWKARRSPVNIDAPWLDAEQARVRVLEIQRKLHRWAGEDHARQFVDLYNLVYDPAVLLVAWRRVRGNRGARSAGVDGETAYYVETVRGVTAFLSELHDDLKARRFCPEMVREVMIPKPGGKRRRLGIATVRDRVVQAALLTVLEPIFEVDFHPCSYGFRPKRRAQDAIAEVHFYASHSYEWVLEGDIEACFDNIDHTALMDRVRQRVGDKRVLGLVKAFCKAGILGEDGAERDTITGTPQGGFFHPCCRTSRCPSSTIISPRHGRDGELARTVATPTPRVGQLPPGPLRGRLSGDGGRYRSRRRTAARRGGGGA